MPLICKNMPQGIEIPLQAHCQSNITQVTCLGIQSPMALSANKN